VQVSVQLAAMDTLTGFVTPDVMAPNSRVRFGRMGQRPVLSPQVKTLRIPVGLN